MACSIDITLPLAYDYLMIRVQIQLPDPLARQLKGIAGARDISFAELCRRGLERYASQWAVDAVEDSEAWEFPVLPPRAMNEDAALLRQENGITESRAR